MSRDNDNFTQGIVYAAARCIEVFAVIVLLLIGLSASAEEAKWDDGTVYGLSQLHLQYLNETCPHTEDKPNFYCLSVAERVVTQYARFCKWLVGGSSSDPSENPKECKAAKVEKYNEWFEFESDELEKSFNQ